jgi:SAM-dependent methyltransferase
MFDVEDTYWWFVARRQLVHDLLRRYPPETSRARPVLLDIGCGTGATLHTLEELGEAVGMDRSLHALARCQQRGHRLLAQADGTRLPVADGSVDVITALDLLEHIPDDAAAAAEFARALRPGGVLVVTVPACPLLWSEHDEALDHLRRYRARELHRLLAGAGFRVARLSPLITTLLLPIAALRLAQRLVPRAKGRAQTALIIPPRWINAILTNLLQAENRWLLRANLPVGVSLFAVARKP